MGAVAATRWKRLAAAALVLVAIALTATGCGDDPKPKLDLHTDEPLSSLLRPARLADDAPVDGSRTEWWYVTAVDPPTGRAVTVVFYAHPYPVAFGYLYTKKRITNWTQLSRMTPKKGKVVAFDEGAITYRPKSRTWVVDQDAKGYRVHLVLSEVRRGITTIKGSGVGDEIGKWTVPIATSRVDGQVVQPNGRRIAVKGWRGYHEHTWGTFTFQSNTFVGWEWAAIHEPGGKAWIMAAPKLFNGGYVPYMLRVTPTKTTTCRPQVSLAGTIASNVKGFSLPERIVARCGSRTVNFRVTRPFAIPLVGYYLGESVGATDVKGSMGMIEHFARLSKK